MQITTEIDPELYNKASKILSEIELTVDDVLKDILTRVVESNTYPSLLIPNAETIAAMEEFDTDDLPSFDTVEDLMRDLNNEKK